MIWYRRQIAPGSPKEERATMADLSMKRRLASAAVLALIAAAAVAVAATSASAKRAAPAVAAQACGQDVSYTDKIKDPDGAFKKLPAKIQARYGPWPYQVKSTPWESFKGVKR